MIHGINFLRALYRSFGVSLPTGFEMISKIEREVDATDGKEKCRSKVSKQTHHQKFLKQAVRIQILIKSMLNEVWFASAENMMSVNHDRKRHFVMPLKSNGKVALSLGDKCHGCFVSVDILPTVINCIPAEVKGAIYDRMRYLLGFQDNTVQRITPEGVDFPLLLLQQVFGNEDGSHGIPYLASSETILMHNEILLIDHKRWNIEP